MQALILAAGYATRLYPLTENQPKALLDVAGKPILERILEKTERVAAVRGIVIVSNARFHGCFTDWLETHRRPKPVTVLNDGTTANETRLGAIADLALAVAKLKIDEDLLVLAGDNLFDFELTDFVAHFIRVGRDLITVHELDDLARLRRTGVAQLDGEGRVIEFEEKPREPRSKLAVPPFYLFKQETLPLLQEYLREGNNPDAPGNLIPWLIGRKEIYAFRFTSDRYDIGTLESYEAVRRLFAQRKRVDK